MTLHVHHLISPIHDPNGHCIPQSLNLSSKSHVFLSFASVSRRTQIGSFVLSARNKGRRSSSGHQRTARFLLKSLSFFARNLLTLPQPLDSVIAELGGGGDGGGGLGFLGGSDGWRGKGKRISLLVLFWIVLGFFGFCIVSGQESRNDMVFPVLGFIFFGIALAKELKIKSKDLAAGVFCIGASLVVGLKREKKDFIRSFSSALIHLKRQYKRSHRRV